MNALKRPSKERISTLPQHRNLNTSIYSIIVYHMHMFNFLQHLHYLLKYTQNLYLPRMNIHYHLATFLIYIFIYCVLPIHFETGPFGHLLKFIIDILIIDV